MYNFKMWINGKFVEAESGKTFSVVNPATEEKIAELPLGDKADVDKAVAAAKAAFPRWSKQPQADRSRILSKVADVLLSYADELGKLECIDHGIPIDSALWMGHMPGWAIGGAAEMAKNLMGEMGPRSPSALIYMQREPIGVCALITPWNVPLVMAASKLSACLAMGNTCVLKPPSIDSLSTLKLAEALAKSDLPKGVVNVITGPGGSVGEALASHSDVRIVSFTGSSETGKRIMEIGSCNMKQLTLELGGKNPFIVLDDADIDATVRCAVHSSYYNTGQICASPGRYYLHEKIYEEFVAKFTAAAKKVIVGNPMDPKTQMGPLVSSEHRNRVESYIKCGVEQGAKLVVGGKRPTAPPLDKGFFVMPTVFTGVTLDMKIGREEIFGPVACIMKPFSSEDKMLESVNDNNYGLGGSVWTKNSARGMKMAAEVQAGVVWVNDHMLMSQGIPWGGIKESGIGRENTALGLEEYSQLKVVYVDLTGKKDQTWNPTLE
jgi:acyl-CoA reductase-like NAD-dependent aldehyde dehydrogenase